MTAHALVALTAAFAAFLTLYSGFGLGTLLLPVFGGALTSCFFVFVALYSLQLY